MEFKIKGSKNETKNKDVFFFEIKVMFGDADGYKTIEVGGFPKNEKAQEHMTDLVKVLSKIDSADTEEYNDVKGFDKWFNPNFRIPENFKDDFSKMNSWEKSLFLNGWPEDTRSWTNAKLDGYEVIYYDSLGNKHEVEILISDEEYEEMEDEETEDE